MIHHVCANTLVLAAILTTPLSLIGCGAFPQEDLPAGLAYIVEHADELASDPDDSSWTVTIQTTIEDLNELGGCWGAVVRSPTGTANQTLDLYQFLSYDADSGRLTRSCINNLWDDWLVMVTVQTGDLTLDNDGRIIFQVDKDVGNVLNRPLREVTYDTLPRYEMRATFESDDVLRAAFIPLGAGAGTPNEFADNWETNHRRLDCQE